MSDLERPKRLQLRKTPRQDRSTALVDDILEAAARVLVDVGFEQMNTNLVAERAGVSVGSLYQYFPHKDALVAELIARRAYEEQTFMREWIGELPTENLEASLEAVVRGALAFRATNPALHRALLSQMPHIGRFGALRERVERAAGPVVSLLERHRDRLPNQDVGLARFVLVNTIHGLTHDGALAPPPQLDDEELVGAIMRLVAGYLETPRPQTTPDG